MDLKSAVRGLVGMSQSERQAVLLAADILSEDAKGVEVTDVVVAGEKMGKGILSVATRETDPDPKGSPRERAQIAEDICDVLFKAESAGMSRREIGDALSKVPRYSQSYKFRTALQYLVSDGRVSRIGEGATTRYVTKTFVIPKP